MTFDNRSIDNALGALVVWPNVASPSFVDVKSEAAGANCATGGQKITVGNAINTAGVISNATFTVTYVCNGSNGDDGQDGADGQDGDNGVDGQDGTNGADGQMAPMARTVRMAPTGRTPW